MAHVTPAFLLEPGSTCWRVERARRFAFLIDGAAYFAALHQALREAQRSILVLAWDVDRHVRLIPGARRGAAGGFPVAFGPLLDELARRRPHLHAEVLCWDPALVYAFERKWLAAYRWSLEGHSRVRYHADNHIPQWAAHHQKVITIDDRLAFAGGLDVTRHRWDTSEHREHDPHRRAHGLVHRPFHDVHCVMEGPAALALAELARARWEAATGERLSPVPSELRDRPIWPAITPWVQDVPVAILRTQPNHGALEQVREVARFNDAAIAMARRHIYLESQYMTSSHVARALCARLCEDDGPEVTIVMSERSDGWLEHQTMDTLRADVFAALNEADRHRRLGVYFPSLGKDRASLTVHSKVMIIDDIVARVGSSNLSNRSMGLDTECDIAIEARGREDVERAIVRLRHTLMAEHLGVSPGELAAVERRCSSLIATVERLSAGREHARTLVPIVAAARPDVVLGGPGQIFADPMEPVDSGALLQELIAPEEQQKVPGRALGLGALIVIVITGTAVWYLTDVGRDGATFIEQWLAGASRSPLRLAATTVAFALATVLGLPVTVAIGLCALMLGTWTSFAVSLTGAVTSALCSYGLGHWLGRDWLGRLTFDRFVVVQRALGTRGIVSILFLRVVPIAPFAVINLAAGAAEVRLRDFVIGTVLGLAPGIVGLSVLIDSIVVAIRDPSVTTLALVIIILALGATLLIALIRWTTRIDGSVSTTT